MSGHPGDVRALVAQHLDGPEEVQRALRRFERLATLGTTLAGVAHELNNPLAAIIGFAQLLRTRPLSPDDLVAVETILREAERTARIVRDLLSVVRQRETREPGVVNVNDVVGYVAGTRRYTLETNDIACSIVLDPSLPRVLGDRAQLEQVVLNLLLNAEQSLLTAGTPAGRRAAIRVSTRLQGPNVVVAVSDNGSGVSAESLDRIWDPFFTTRADDGSGLGLSVVRGIISAHHGTATVRPTEGGGATFEIRLPACRHEPTADGAPDAPPALDVLVVDQDEQSREFVRGYLAARGHAVLTAGSGADALCLSERLRFEAMVVDASTVAPAADFMERMRALPGLGRARIVLVVPEGEQAGVADGDDAPRLAKPYDLDQLRRFIEPAPR